ncbi:nitroreductase family deazaflavin-dependent oxidoreductase [Demequina gelatinilytica]|uniref:nitroreductase family deazaflavin-dependent oxidoreductase n=1 Tax=Demequina gelatinilytica TaxID=1638980 RepID=UPI0007831AA1|nr:nitroreductase family deazaflavin-dependent oxidoreductase [Demequina gelatinilytica]
MTSAIDLHGPAHVARYLETDGADGHDWRHGTTVLLLTTVGRRSGEARTSPLIYREWDGALIVVASKGGADKPPAWFLNLAAHPEVGVQVRADRFPARARIATAEEKPAMWAAMVEAWPDYDAYQQRTDRDIPVVVLERV